MPNVLKSPPRVALLVGGWNQYGRSIIEGVWQYSQKHGPWFLDIEPGMQDGRTVISPDWQGEGVIAQIHSPELADGARSFGVPVVNVSGSRIDRNGFPRVTSDSTAVVRKAIQHLKDYGHKTIAFCGEPQREFLDFWTESYLTACDEAQVTPIVYSHIQNLSANPTPDEVRFDHQLWLRGLPKPIGVIGWATFTCRQLAMACFQLGLDVPNDVSIISLSTDDLLAKVIHPPISGVDIPAKKIGYESARMLDQLMRGQNLSSSEIRIPPLGVTRRQSSDSLHVDDPDIRMAITFIRNNAYTGIDVRDVLNVVPLSRRTLERRFKELIGRSPAEEIRRTKIERVRRLLGETDMFIPDIAQACGFNYVEHMIPVFKKYFGCTPLVYRKRALTRTIG